MSALNHSLIHTGSSPCLGCNSVRSHMLSLHIHFLSSGIFGSYELWFILGNYLSYLNVHKEMKVEVGIYSPNPALFSDRERSLTHRCYSQNWSPRCCDDWSRISSASTPSPAGGTSSWHKGLVMRGASKQFEIQL